MVNIYPKNPSLLVPKLPRFTLSKKNDVWQLTDSGGHLQKEFGTKAQATAGGVLEKAVGPSGGSVKIHKENGKFQEERTYPGSEDPRKSPG